MRVAVVQDGIVVNVVSANKVEHVALRFKGSQVVPCGVDQPVGKGWNYDGIEFTYPESENETASD